MDRLTLVTGGTGFVGSHLVDALVARGIYVRCMVIEGSDLTHLKNLGVEIVYGDLSDKVSLEKAVKNVDTVYHLAAHVRPLKVIYGLHELSNIYHRINVLGTINLAEVSFNKGIRRFIYYSSISAAGFSIGLSENTQQNSISEYGKSKLKAEILLLDLFRNKKFPVIIVRPGQIFGPRNLPMLILFKLIKKGVLPFFGKGNNLIPLCYIDNLIKATLLVEEKSRLGETYFIFDNHYSLGRLVQTIAETMDVPLSTIHIPQEIAYNVIYLKETFEKIFRFRFYPFCMDLGITTVTAAYTDRVCSNDKIREELYYEPEVDFEEGISRTVRWYKEKGYL